MAKFIGVVLTAIIMIPLLILGAVFGVLGGAFGGWIVGFFFPHTFGAWLQYFGLPRGLGQIEPWQVGAMLGFVGGFFRASVTSKSS